MKKLIFSTDITGYDDDEIKNEISENNNIPIEDITDDEVIEYINTMISNWYEDENVNLNKYLDGDVICIADLGLWNGRRCGYKVYGNNLNEILHYQGDDYEVYVEDGEVMADDIHHDGRNHYIWRVFKSGIDEDSAEEFLNALYNGDCDEDMMNEYTDSLAPFVRQIYGW